jgi:endonuclease/exonuclease/phosphatase (EEP) superfamily protein YafD
MNQFNVYKFTELKQKLDTVAEFWEKKNRDLALEILEEWCWTCPRQSLFTNWERQNQHQHVCANNLTLLHYNIRNFYSNQCELLDMIERYNPNVISLNELGTQVPTTVIRKLLFSYDIFQAEGSNSHGGVVVAVDKLFNARAIDLKQSNIISILVSINQKTYTFTSVYSPPTEALPLQALTQITKTSKFNIIAGDFNAKHEQWGCSTRNTKGRDLAEWLQENNMLVHNQGMTTSLRSKTTIDLIISTENHSSVQCQPLAYNGSDHLPIMVEFTDIPIAYQENIIPKVNWEIYSTILTILHTEIYDNCQTNYPNPSEWFDFFQHFLSALKIRATKWRKVKRKRPTISKALKILIKHKHYLQNRYRHTKTEEDRLSLRTWHKITQRELKQHRANCWKHFISNVASPNPSTFWKTVKTLNKKRSVQFSALKDESHIYNDSNQVLSHLKHHFATRFAKPNTDLNVQTDAEAHKLWEKLSQANPDDIQLACHESDLKFTPKEVWDVITAMKSKNSSGFDRISNKMIKQLPQDYAHILAFQYNALFATVHWSVSWKRARTVCFNKTDNPALSTQQLRPISLLPVLGKVYERLFLLRFQKWLQSYNILPWQQSGCRAKQSTNSRVSHLLEQLTNSLRYNTFTPIIFVDFKQAFDMLWQEGLILKLDRLHCPIPYLLWITNYFKDRSMSIDFNGLISDNITNCCSS